MTGRVNVPVALLLAVCLMPAGAFSQNSAHGHWVTDPNNIATPAFVYDSPPAGFDPLTASDAELSQWGFLRRPDINDAAAYAQWEKLVTTKRVAPEVVFASIYQGLAKDIKIGQSTQQSTAATTPNWSGYVIAGQNGLFSSGGSTIVASWVVPAAHQSVSPPTCTSTWYYSSQWVGFDGWGTNDVLQAGTEADANCSSTLYSFWYEWFPLSETRISLPVSAGDSVTVFVSYEPTSPQGTATLFNLTTGQNATVQFNPPSGTTYVGNSAEWVLERPTLNGVYADLPNYSQDWFNAISASNNKTTYSPSGPTPPSGAIYSVTMTCPPWNPSSACTSTTSISKVWLFSLGTCGGIFGPPCGDALLFYDEAPAY